MLRNLALFLLAAPLLLNAQVASLHAIYTPETAITNPALAGLWGAGFVEFRIAEDGKYGYVVTSDEHEFLRIHLVRIGAETFADLTLVSGFFETPLPFHVIARLRIEGDRLEVDWLGSDELEARIAQPDGPRHELIEMDGENVTMLTASTPELQRFLLDCLARPDSFGSHDSLERPSAAARAKDLNRRSWSVVVQPGRHDGYVDALELAQEAVRLDSGDPDFWNTLALARLRAGHIQEALGACIQAESLRSLPDPGDLAIHVLILDRLGLTDEARAALGRLHLLLADHQHCGDADMLKLLREAEDTVARKVPR